MYRHVVTKWPALKKIFKGVWVFLCVLVFCVTITHYDGTPNSDVEIFLMYSMLVFSFPSGFIFVLLLSCVNWLFYHFFNIVIKTSYAELTVNWIGFFVLGYFQWFIAIPYLLRRFLLKK